MQNPVGQAGKREDIVTSGARKSVAAVSDEELLAMKPLKPRKKATFDCPSPSNFCHICSRTPSRGIRLAVCAGLLAGHCRKVVCERCFKEYDFGITFDEACDANKKWKCTHCSGSCPSRAQCRTYQNVNRKLRLQRLRQSVSTSLGTKNGAPSLPLATTAQKTTTSPPLSSHNEKRACRHSSKFLGEKFANSLDSPSSITQLVSSSRGSSSIKKTKKEPVSGKKNECGVKQNAYMNTEMQRHGTESSRPIRTLCHVCGTMCGFSDASTYVKCSASLNRKCTEIICASCIRSSALIRSSLDSSQRLGQNWNCCHCTSSCPEDSTCLKTPGTDCSRNIPLTDTIKHRRSQIQSLKSRLLAAAASPYTSYE